MNPIDEVLDAVFADDSGSTSTIKPGDWLPVPLKDATARVGAVADHDTRCPLRANCSHPDVPMVLVSVDGLKWAWVHDRTIVGAEVDR